MRSLFIYAGMICIVAALALGREEEGKRVTVGIQNSPAMALVMIAKDRRFFEREGLEAELKEFTAGKFALQAFLGGSLDFAVAGEVPVTLATLQGNEFFVLAQAVEKTISEVRVVARRDESAGDAAAYFKKQRRVLATSAGGGPEFFTAEFLERHGIDESLVTLVNQKPEDMPAALISGSVDAIAIFDPFAFIAEKQLGEKAVTFADPALYSELYVITASRQTVETKREKVESFLRALTHAQKFIEEHPDESKNIVAKYTKLDRAVIDGIWGNFVFSPVLHERLLDYQRAQARWAKRRNFVPAGTPLPDFRKRIFAAPLRNVAPEAVQLSGAQ